MNKYSKIITLKWEKYYNSVLSFGHQCTEKGAVYIEVNKLKWELKKKYQELGKYVTKEKEAKSVIDFSHDQLYLHKINEIIRLKFYIEERLKLKETL